MSVLFLLSLRLLRFWFRWDWVSGLGITSGHAVQNVGDWKQKNEREAKRCGMGVYLSEQDVLLYGIHRDTCISVLE